VILHVPDCPLVDRLRATVQSALKTVEIEANIEEMEGAFASPTLLVDGVEVSESSFHDGPSCRLELPTKGDVLAALAYHGLPEGAP
jgi:hypothetical protein